MFIPLKSEFYDAFKVGTKTTEYRIYGPRWNERTCRVGRAVVLSKGYGKQNRLQGEVTAFEVSRKPTRTSAWRKCYGSRSVRAACITVAVRAGVCIDVMKKKKVAKSMEQPVEVSGKRGSWKAVKRQWKRK